MTNDKALQDPTITQIERTGYPQSVFKHEPIIFECSICNATIAEEQSKFHLCEKCEHEALKRFKFFLCNEFTDNEREYLDTCTEGISLTEPQKIKDVKAVIM